MRSPERPARGGLRGERFRRRRGLCTRDVLSGRAGIRHGIWKLGGLGVGGRGGSRGGWRLRSCRFRRFRVSDSQKAKRRVRRSCGWGLGARSGVACCWLLY